MNQTTATRGGFSFTFTRRQPVFAGCSEFIPGLKTELGEVHHKFAVHDSRIHGGSVYYTCKIFPQHCFFNFSSVIWEFVTSSPKVSLGPFSFSICSVYFKLPWIILLILHSYYPLFNLAWILFRSTAPNPVLAAQSLAVSLYPKYQTPVPTTVYPSMIHVPTIKKEIAENPYSFQGTCQHCSLQVNNYLTDDMRAKWMLSIQQALCLKPVQSHPWGPSLNKMIPLTMAYCDHAVTVKDELCLHIEVFTEMWKARMETNSTFFLFYIQ